MADESKDDANRELIEAIRSFKEESVKAIHSLREEIDYLKQATRENNPREIERQRRLDAEHEWEWKWFEDHGEWPPDDARPEALGKESKGKEADAARQVLAAYYLLNVLGVRADIHGQKKHVVALIALITGRHPKTVERELGNVDDGAKPEDLEFILPFFENVKLKAIADKIRENF